jgi:predicted transcriptional regulator|tara:strand:+ start:482 stop:841 length:360 start_codon:yes stop_codon:yes gene_type:complete
MRTTKTQNFILFILGRWYEEANKKIKGKPLEVCISKKTFIELVTKSGIAKKQDRALYKNLENLGKKKLINYNNKELMLTLKGKKLFEKINKQIKPYLNLNDKLKEKPMSYTRKVQTILK